MIELNHWDIYFKSAYDFLFSLHLSSEYSNHVFLLCKAAL